MNILRTREGAVKYTDSASLFMDFMLDRIQQEEMLQAICSLSDCERQKLFSIRKMKIFQSVYENSRFTISEARS